MTSISNGPFVGQIQRSPTDGPNGPGGVPPTTSRPLEDLFQAQAAAQGRTGAVAQKPAPKVPAETQIALQGLNRAVDTARALSRTTANIPGAAGDGLRATAVADLQTQIRAAAASLAGKDPTTQAVLESTAQGLDKYLKRGEAYLGRNAATTTQADFVAALDDVSGRLAKLTPATAAPAAPLSPAEHAREQRALAAGQEMLRSVGATVVRVGAQLESQADVLGPALAKLDKVGPNPTRAQIVSILTEAGVRPATIDRLGSRPAQEEVLSMLAEVGGGYDKIAGEARAALQADVMKLASVTGEAHPLVREMRALLNGPKGSAEFLESLPSIQNRLESLLADKADALKTPPRQ